MLDAATPSQETAVESIPDSVVLEEDYFDQVLSTDLGLTEQLLESWDNIDDCDIIMVLLSGA